MSHPDGAWQGAAALLPFPVPSGTPLAGYAARTGGLPAITLTCSNERGYASRRLTERALAQAEAFCAELIHRIDAEIGPELRRRS